MHLCLASFMCRPGGRAGAISVRSPAEVCGLSCGLFCRVHTFSKKVCSFSVASGVARSPYAYFAYFAYFFSTQSRKENKKKTIHTSPLKQVRKVCKVCRWPCARIVSRPDGAYFFLRVCTSQKSTPACRVCDFTPKHR